jgi:hypothetical protein
MDHGTGLDDTEKSESCDADRCLVVEVVRWSW